MLEGEVRRPLISKRVDAKSFEMNYGLSSNNNNDNHTSSSSSNNVSLHNHEISEITTQYRDDDEDELIRRPSIAHMMTTEFYQRPVSEWISELCEGLFKVRIRGSTIRAEIYFGLIHYISCFYCLAVIPNIMSSVGYESGPMFTITAFASGMGSILGGLVINLPFPFAPTTVIAIFMQTYLRAFSSGNATAIGSAAVVISGGAISLLGYRPFANFISRLIPSSIQVGTSIGIGLLVALAGATEIGLVQSGTDSALLRMGPVTPPVIIALFGVVLICVLVHYHVTGPFAIAIIVCSFIGWAVSGNWPTGVFGLSSTVRLDTSGFNNEEVILLAIDLLILYILYLAGLTSSLSRLADLTREDGQIPRGRWIYVFVGIITVLSGLLTGVPILLSPEGAAAIKDGAKTGLSTVVCGFLFLLSIFFAPIFQAIPSEGSSPILIMVGALLFQNVSRIDWRLVKESAPGFIVLFFIPFTFSLLQGVLIGYAIYLTVNLCSGDLWYDFLAMVEIYFPQWYDRYLHSDTKDTENDTLPTTDELTLSHSLVPSGDPDQSDHPPRPPSLTPAQLKRQESSSRPSLNRAPTEHYIMGFSENDTIPSTFPTAPSVDIPPPQSTPTRLLRTNSASVSQRPSLQSSMSTRLRGDTLEASDNPFVTGS